MAIRLVLADDHPLLLKGLADLLRSDPEFDVLAVCQDGDEALAAVRMHRPDVLITDLRMPGKDGLAVLREIREQRWPTRVVLLVAELADEHLLEATRLGVGGVVLKEMASRLLVQAIRKVHAGETWMERRAAARAFETLLRREAGAREIAKILTPREIQILHLAATGSPNEAIAETLSVAQGTVKTHLHRIYEKLRIKTRLELILYCREKGML